MLTDDKRLASHSESDSTRLTAARTETREVEGDGLQYSLETQAGEPQLRLAVGRRLMKCPMSRSGPGLRAISKMDITEKLLWNCIFMAGDELR